MPAATRTRKRQLKPRTPVDPDALLVEAETLVHFHGFAWQRGRPTTALTGKNVIPELARRHHLTTRSITRILQIAKRHRRAHQRTIPVSYAQGLAAAYAGQRRVDPCPRVPAAASASPPPLPSPAAPPTTAAAALAKALLAFLCRPDGATRQTIAMAMALLEDIKPTRR